MLILTRKADEEIIINSNIKIKILAINDNQIKIGIDAPNEVSIFRGEIYDKVKQTTIEASKSSSEKIDTSKLNLKIRKITDAR